MYSANKDDTLSNLKNTTPTARSMQSEAKEGIRDAASKASNKVLKLVRSAGGELTHAKDTVTSQIRSKPVRSSAVALGVGFLIGALIRGRRA